MRYIISMDQSTDAVRLMQFRGDHLNADVCVSAAEELSGIGAAYEGDLQTLCTEDGRENPRGEAQLLEDCVGKYSVIEVKKYGVHQCGADA